MRDHGAWRPLVVEITKPQAGLIACGLQFFKLLLSTFRCRIHRLNHLILWIIKLLLVRSVIHVSCTVSIWVILYRLHLWFFLWFSLISACWSMNLMINWGWIHEVLPGSFLIRRLYLGMTGCGDRSIWINKLCLYSFNQRGWICRMMTCNLRRLHSWWTTQKRSFWTQARGRRSVVRRCRNYRHVFTSATVSDSVRDLCDISGMLQSQFSISINFWMHLHWSLLLNKNCDLVIYSLLQMFEIAGSSGLSLL